MLTAHLVYCQISLEQIRDNYYKAYEDENQVEFFWEYMKRLQSSNTTIEGYRSLSLIFMAKEGWNPVTKYAYFKTGKNKLDSVIGADKENVELRFLRYTVQRNAPEFLGYNENLTEDKNKILDQYKQLNDVDLKVRMAAYMRNDEGLTENERRTFL